MFSCRTSQINQLINQSISRSFNQSIKLLNGKCIVYDLEPRSMLESLIRPTGNTCKQILRYMTRFMLQIFSVVSSIQVEAVSLTHYFLFCEKWLWFLRHFYEGCFVAKGRFLKMWTGSWILWLSNILHQTFLTSNLGSTLCKSVESVKDLGVTINYDLSWGKHVSYIENKANRVLGEIKRSLGNDIRHAFSCLFKSLVRPQYSYMLPPPGAPTKKNYIESLEKVQRRASRLESRELLSVIQCYKIVRE